MGTPRTVVSATNRVAEMKYILFALRYVFTAIVAWLFVLVLVGY
jgi:hypothetical protein